MRERERRGRAGGRNPARDESRPRAWSVGLRLSRRNVAFSALLVVLVMIAALAAAAGAASSGAPTPTPAQPDNEITPVAKPSAQWQQFGGAVFPLADSPKYDPKVSPTPVSADLFSTAFRNQKNGFAVGAICKDTATSLADITAGKCDQPAAAGQGGRLPVIYQYTDKLGEGPLWKEVYGPELSSPGADKPGYIGGVAWIGPGKALAVGGDGVYPRREQDPSTAANDVAGHARAWLYQNGVWTEITDQLPKDDGHGNPMRGLSALGCPKFSDAQTDSCVAGGFQQLWMWSIQNDRFTTAYTGGADPAHRSAEGQLNNADGFRFRVRSFAFVPNHPTFINNTTIVAFTAGCCANPADPPQVNLNQSDPFTSHVTNNVPRGLAFDGTQWYVRLLNDDPNSDSNKLANGRGPLFTGSYRSASVKQSLPDSYYAGIISSQTDAQGNVTTPVVSVITTPGGPSQATGNLAADSIREPASRIFGQLEIPGNQAHSSGLGSTQGPATRGGLVRELNDPRLSDVRLNGGDGDITGLSEGGISANPVSLVSPSSKADGTIDWGVGELYSTGQGAAYTTTQRGARVPDPTSCPGGYTSQVPTNPTGCRPNQQAPTAQQASQALIVLPTYQLNSFVMVGDTGVGWAVGDKGAIAKLGGTSGDTSISEPPVPTLGAAQPGGSDGSPYEAFRPFPAAQAGVVPALAGQPLVGGAQPQWVAAGSADPTRPGPPYQNTERATGIVMSRDGAQGWAFGSGDSIQGDDQFALDRYDGTRWSRCAVEGIPGQLAPDPACAQLASYRHLVNTGQGANPVNISAATRVPMENGGDASRSNDFEVVAATNGYFDPSDHQYLARLIRYRSGVWTPDREGTLELNLFSGQGYLVDLAFSAPDDGWAITDGGVIYHFDGRKSDGGHGWVSCATRPALCFDVAAKPRLAGIVKPRLLVVGGRVYLYGTRTVGASTGGSVAAQATRFPVIVFHDHRSSALWSAGPAAGTDGAPAGVDNGYDNPTDSNTADQGSVRSLSVAADGGGGVRGWASGFFGGSSRGSPAQTGGRLTPLDSELPALMRFEPKAGWKAWPLNGDAAQDYLADPNIDSSGNRTVSLTFAGSSGAGTSVIGNLLGFGSLHNVPLLRFDPGTQRWRVLGAPFNLAQVLRCEDDGRKLQAMASDGQQGFWVVVRDVCASRYEYFYHYTDRVPRPVFKDVAHPVREQITSAAGGHDGSLWVATNSSVLYRYDRLAGWDRFPVAGWDPGSVVTASSSANAVAVGPDGSGVAVGKGGRIADLRRGGAVLDPAAGRICSQGLPEPCGTSYDLHAAAVAPDGSAMAGGDARTLLWRPAGGAFHTIPKPPVAASAQITAISMPSPDRAWLTTNKGNVVAGQRSGSDWTFSAENLNEGGDVLALDDLGRSLALHGVAIDAAGRGYAVGDRGLMLERTGDRVHPWRRLASGFLDNFHSVTLSAGGGPGVLVGGEHGLVLTGNGGRFEIAHAADRVNGIDAGTQDHVGSRVVGVALLPGVKTGQVEAWAAQQIPDTPINLRQPGPQAVLHYASDASEPLLHLDRVQPLPDSPLARPGELRFSAFGKSECSLAPDPCPEMTGATRRNEILSQRITTELARSASGQAPPAFSLFTGDVSDAAGRGSGSDVAASLLKIKAESDPSVTHHRFTDLVGGPLASAQSPLFAALGGQDLSSTHACSAIGGACAGDNGQKTGSNLAWREAFSGMPEPWGTGTAVKSGTYEFTPAGQSTRTPDTSATSPLDGSKTAVPSGGASTHYAFDVKRDGNAIARVVVLDSSLRSLSASDPAQQPSEAQLTWLNSVLSSRGSSEQAIVVTNTPTYSYGPGSASDTASDASALEAVLENNKVNAVVSGRLGWNALYWTTAAALHSPCAGDDYPDQTHVPAAASNPNCGAAASGTPTTPDAANQLAGSLLSAAAPAPPVGCSGSGANGTGVIPNVVASSAGGKFGPDGTATGSADKQGFWHGYTMIRLDKSGDPRCTIVEQRPVFDWVGIQAAAHVLRPGQHVTLKGYGREPVGSDQPISYDAINGPAITHRYDLLKADPARPYLPDTSCPKTTDNPAGYCELSDTSVGNIDPIKGTVTTGRGNHPRVYAIGVLSVGQRAASWPLVFEPRRSYTPVAPARVVTPALPVVPQVHVAAIAATSPPPPPSAPPPAPPSVGTPTLPQLLGLPGLPPLNTPPPAAPPPPAGAPPPAPPASQAPSALSISVSPQSVGFAPPSGVVPPPAPPINPAPPGGARREAKAKQPAAAKSEESGAAEGGDSKVEMADGPMAPPGTSAMTRHAPDQRPLAFRAMRRESQPSAWTRGALYGGGLVMMALLLALASTALPTPRRRPPTVSAPAWARRRPPGG